MSQERGKLFTVFVVVAGLVVSVALGWYFLTSFTPKVSFPETPAPAEPQ